MRIKSLSIIASFLVFSLAITSCLDSDNDYELSSDDLITAFSLDTIYGETYKFTIDQINGLIYNVDSVPYSADTIINKILIKTLTTNGFVTSGTDFAEPYSQDTIFNYTDSIDFMKHNPLKVRVRSYDGLHIKPYSIEVRMHQTDPDTLVWGNDPDITDDAYIQAFTGGKINTASESKAILLGNEILVFAFNGSTISAYKGASKEQFQDVATNIPTNMKISSIQNVKGTLYGTTEDGEVFASTDGATWSKVTSDATVVNLLTIFKETIAGIIKNNDGTANVFAVATVNTDGSLTWKTSANGSIVPDNFPTKHIVATKYLTPTGSQQALLIGEPVENDATATSPWFTTDGYNWDYLTPTKTKYALPVMSEPSILYYGNTIYAFGNVKDEGFSYIYTSINGIVWEKIEKKFMFPFNDEASAFKDRTGGYSMVVDNDNYLWMFWNQKDDAWRGKLNRLGFIIQ